MTVAKLSSNDPMNVASDTPPKGRSSPVSGWMVTGHCT